MIASTNCSLSGVAIGLISGAHRTLQLEIIFRGLIRLALILGNLSRLRSVNRP